MTQSDKNRCLSPLKAPFTHLFYPLFFSVTLFPIPPFRAPIPKAKKGVRESKMAQTTPSPSVGVAVIE